jgi:hypothetical protein
MSVSRFPQVYSVGGLTSNMYSDLIYYLYGLVLPKVFNQQDEGNVIAMNKRDEVV